MEYKDVDKEWKFHSQGGYRTKGDFQIFYEVVKYVWFSELVVSIGYIPTGFA